MLKINFLTANQEHLPHLVPHPGELPPKFKHAKKNEMHFLSRYALTRLIEQKFQRNIPYQELELINFQNIELIPQQIFSLAHTETSVVVTSASKESFNGIGVDIEHQHRPIKPESAHYFINEQDQHTGDLLTQWCIKEACFKALSNSGSPIKLLKEVVIKEDQFHYINDAPSPFNQIKIIKQNEHILVFAYCRKDESSVELNSVKINAVKMNIQEQ